MTKETRTNVSAQINTVEDLRPGDKVVVRYRKGHQIETKLVYTFGAIQNGLIKTEGYDDVMGSELFNVLVPGYDSAVTTVWRKVEPLPSEVGSMIYVHELTKSNRMSHYVSSGLAVLRGSGSWEFVLHPEVKFGAANVAEWSHVNIETTN